MFKKKNEELEQRKQMEKNQQPELEVVLNTDEREDKNANTKKKGFLSNNPKKKFKKKTIIFVLIGIIIAGSVFYSKFFGQPKETEIPVSIGKVEKRDIEETVIVDGPVQGSETAEVTSVLNSKILQINVKEGDYVTKGQVLAVLDGTDIQNDIRQAQDRLELSKLTMEDGIKQQQNNYDSAVLTMNETKRVMEQNRSLFEAGAISEDDFLISKDAYEKAASMVDGFHAVDGKVVASASQQKGIAVDSDAIAIKRQELEKTLIKSPINGTVTRVNARLGRYAADTENKAAMFVIEDLVNLNIKVRVSETQIGKIEIGQPVTITSKILGDETLSGIVSQIAPSGENKDVDGKQKVIPVTIKITGKNGKLIPGVNAKAKIMIQGKKGILTVPSEAIHADFDGNNKNVFKIKEDGTVQKTPVQTGLEDTFYTEIMSNELKEGDKIVKKSDEVLEDGIKIKDQGHSVLDEKGKASEQPQVQLKKEEGETDAQ